MNAKPKMKDVVESQNGVSTSSRQKDSEGQDIFVDDDPAIQLSKTLQQTDQKDATTKAFQSDLKIEKLTYIHQMLGELRKLSITLDEPMVAYLIEMALLEADTALNVGHFAMDLGGQKNKGRL